jgi:hypothetical protein
MQSSCESSQLCSMLCHGRALPELPPLDVAKVVAGRFPVSQEELARCEARIRELEQALEKLEWSSRDEGYPFCPLCLQGTSHSRECLYFALHTKESNG